MKILITGCQSINEKEQVVNACPFCNHVKKPFFNEPNLTCKFGAKLTIYSTVVLNFIPADCPLKNEDITLTIKP